VEADETETSVLTRKLSDILAAKLERGDEALAVLTELADRGDEDIRAAYVELGDRLGWRGIVATKLVEWWFEVEPSARRTEKLRGAFERFVEVGRDEDAVRVACEVVRSKGADRALAQQLEELSIKTRDLDALSMAHDLLVRESTGMDRAQELVRQAETRLTAGAERLEAVQHGEAGLPGVPPDDVDPLLERLAVIAQEPGDIVDLYERQISRCRAPVDRVRALARAARVAAAKAQLERARAFFDLALSGSPTDEMLVTLEESARAGDEETGGDSLRRTLSVAMAGGGQGARDGGRTRGALMLRAAFMAHRELRDVDQALVWLGDSLIAHVETGTLDALEELALEIGAPARAEETLTRALGEVFDGPLVRQLLGRRAKLRRERLDDKPGAAADLKKLHELTPGDQAVNDELVALLTELGDYRAMVTLFEDLILRGKDIHARAELARKVAGMWERELADPREAADAWRRVLRMKTGDPEAIAGLERAKANMLRKPAEGTSSEPPPMASPPPAPVAEAPAAAVAIPAEEPAKPEPSLASAQTTTDPQRSGDRTVAATSPAEPEATEPASSLRETTEATPAAPMPDESPTSPGGEISTATMSTRTARRREGKRRRSEEPKSPPAGSVVRPADGAASAGDSASDRITVTGEAPPREGEVVIADDVTEVIDVEDTADGEDPDHPKRSVPPPLPRG
jgi:tetratricopeptide (TPR) repeat protein